MAEGTGSRIPLTLPHFDGVDPAGWIFKAKRFFDFHDAPDHQRLLISSFCMDGAALRWLQGISSTTPFSTWTAFCQSLETMFGEQQQSFLKIFRFLDAIDAKLDRLVPRLTTPSLPSSAIAASGSSFVSVPRIANNAVSLPQEQLKPISKFPSSVLDFSPDPTINQPQLLVPSIQSQTHLQSLFQPQSLPDSLSQRQPYDNQQLAQADLAENLFKNRSAAAYESKMMKSLRANEYCSSDDQDSHASIDDFEFRLEDPMMMPQTDELFFEEKLVSL